jgi:hypothetical protein
MCVGKGNGSLSTSLQRKPLHLEDGVVGSVEGLGEFLQIIVWNLRVLLGSQPDKHSRKNAFNQLKDHRRVAELTTKPWYILQQQGNRKVEKEGNIRKSARKQVK